MYPAKFLGVSRIYLTLYIIYFIFKYGWAKEYFFCGGGGGEVTRVITPNVPSGYRLDSISSNGFVAGTII